MASFLGHMLRVMDLKRNLFGSAMNLPTGFIVIALMFSELQANIGSNILKSLA